MADYGSEQAIGDQGTQRNRFEGLAAYVERLASMRTEAFQGVSRVDVWNSAGWFCDRLVQSHGCCGEEVDRLVDGAVGILRVTRQIDGGCGVGGACVSGCSSRHACERDGGVKVDQASAVKEVRERDSQFLLAVDRCGVSSDGEGRTRVLGDFEGARDSRGESDVKLADAVRDEVKTSDVGLGVNTLRNRQWRQEKKDRKKRKQRVVASVGRAVGFMSDLSDEVRRELNQSRAQRLQAENRLALERAGRLLELEKAKDMSVLKKRQETKMVRDTENNKVAIERAFGKLVVTGNVPGVGGSVKTVVSGGSSAPGLTSGSVSPNSSVSMAEIHAMQKQNLEMERQIAEIKRLDPELFLRTAKNRADDECTENTGWTPDCNGNPPVELGQIVPDFMDLELEKDGKYHYREGSSWKYIDY